MGDSAVNRLLALVFAFVVSVSGGLLAPPVAHADDLRPTYAKLRESLVMLSITYTGHAVMPGEVLGRPVPGSDTSFSFSCSGFIVDPSGHIATAGHCVEVDDDTATMFRISLIDELVDAQVISPEDRDEVLLQAIQDRWNVEGPQGGEPSIEVQVIQPRSPARVIDTPMVVDVVARQPFMDGDNALLKIANMAPLKPVVISETPPEAGQPVTAIGWPGIIKRNTDLTRLPEPSFKTGTVSSVQVERNGDPKTEISADLSGGMSGGPTIDNSTGEVLGINSYGYSDPSANGLNFITHTETLRNFLTTNGVKLTPPATPAPAPKGGGFPWAIVVVLGMLAAAGAVLAMIVSKRRVVPAGGPAPTAVESTRGQAYLPPQPETALPPESAPGAVLDADVVEPPPTQHNPQQPPPQNPA